MAATFHFAPERVAHFEAAGWRAYYDRRWLRLMQLIVTLCQEQFRIPFPASLMAAYFITRASIGWVPKDHNVATVHSYLEKFYRLARRYSSLTFDPTHVADLELQYFDVHRRLAGGLDKQEFLDALIALHSAIFNLSGEQVRESAQLRLLAADTVDRITSSMSTNVEDDWVKLEEYLRQCYTSIHQQLALQIGVQSSIS